MAGGRGARPLRAGSCGVLLSRRRGVRLSGILLLGATGQVGAELRAILPQLGQLHAPDRSRADFTSADSIRTCVRGIGPDVIVNAAAYNAVDKAEEEPAAAMQVNGTAVGVLAEEAKRANALLVHYSTDYVFDGARDTPYGEDDVPAPVNAYGASKLAGERAIQAVGCRHWILRTSWVYSDRRSNFVLNILTLARERPELEVVDDQFGAPTWARSLARSTRALLRSSSIAGSGIFHLCAGGAASRFELAQGAIELASALSGDVRWARVRAVKSADFALPARRPAKAVLSSDRIALRTGVRMAAWKVELGCYLRQTGVLGRLTRGG